MGQSASFYIGFRDVFYWLIDAADKPADQDKANRDNAVLQLERDMS